MKKVLPLLAAAACCSVIYAQSSSVPFVNANALLPTSTFHSGNAIGVCDMNNDHKDDIVRASGNQVMYVELQQTPNSNFLESSFANEDIGDPWGMAVGDVNNDGFNDVQWGDYGSVKLLKWNGTGYTSTNITSQTSAGFIFVQGCNFHDINNDGFLDAFVCNDVAMSHIYVNNNGTSWTSNNSLIPLATVPTSDNSGNYASVWSDVNNDGYMDLMITHCRQGVSNAADARRIDQVFINNGNGTYTQDVTNWTGLRDGAQGWSTAWGDIDNDGDMDAFVLNYDVNSTLMINDGSGHFTNMIVGSGIASTTTIFGENATFHDFDNDGNLDLMISGDTHILYMGNGDGTFTVSPNPFNYSGYQITAHAVGDLNGDGFLDVYASYCDIFNSPSSRNDHLWMNTSADSGNTNHYVMFDLVGGGAPGYSNTNGVGAIVKIYGSFGVRVREIRSGEGYGIQNTFSAHFGLGAETSIDSVVVAWPSGIVDVIQNPSVDQHVVVNEGAFSTQSPMSLYHPLQMIVSPNPASSEANVSLINLSSYPAGSVDLFVYDIHGRQIFAQSSLVDNRVNLPVEEWNSGMYMIELSQNGQRIMTEKLILE